MLRKHRPAIELAFRFSMYLLVVHYLPNSLYYSNVMWNMLMFPWKQVYCILHAHRHLTQKSRDLFCLGMLSYLRQSKLGSWLCNLLIYAIKLEFSSLVKHFNKFWSTFMEMQYVRSKLQPLWKTTKWNKAKQLTLAFWTLAVTCHPKSFS